MRADEDIQRACGECAQRFLILALGAGGVAVETGDAGTRKFLAQAFFELFGAFAEKIDVLRLALRALLGDLLRGAAVVAFEAVAGFVVGHGDAAVGALHAGAATAAENGPGIATTVNQDQCLGFVGQAFLQASMQSCADRAGLMSLLEVFAEVDDFDASERTSGYAGSQGDEFVFAGLGVVVGF